jgi:hypothetical protein
MRVRVAGQRLTWRLKRRLFDPVDRRDLRAVEDEHGLEQHPDLAGRAVALLDRQRRDDPDRLLALLDREPEQQPGLEAGNERRVRGRASATSSWLENDSRASPACERTRT